MTTNHASRRAMRTGAVKGAKKLARMKRQTRWVAVYRAWSRTCQPMTVAELAAATDRSPAVVRAALADPDYSHKVEKIVESATGVAYYQFKAS